jgi:uncharacterized protein
MLLLIIFILFIIYFSLYIPLVGQRKFSALKFLMRSGKISRINLYLQSMAGVGIPAFIVITLVPAGYLSFSDIGFNGINLNNRTMPFLLISAAVSVYLIYIIHTIIFLRYCAIKGKDNGIVLTDSYRVILPSSRRERRLWCIVSLGAGIFEEILFRGYLLFMLQHLFPGAHIAVVLIISTAIFALGHIYQGVKEVYKPALLGLFYAVIFITCNSIFPCIILHFLQDLSVIDAVRSGSSEENDSSAGNADGGFTAS